MKSRARESSLCVRKSGCEGAEETRAGIPIVLGSLRQTCISSSSRAIITLDILDPQEPTTRYTKHKSCSQPSPTPRLVRCRRQLPPKLAAPAHGSHAQGRSRARARAQQPLIVRWTLFRKDSNRRNSARMRQTSTSMKPISPRPIPTVRAVRTEAIVCHSSELTRAAPAYTGKLKTLLGILKKTLNVKDLTSVRVSLPAQLMEPM